MENYVIEAVDIPGSQSKIHITAIASGNRFDLKIDSGALVQCCFHEHTTIHENPLYNQHVRKDHADIILKHGNAYVRNL